MAKRHEAGPTADPCGGGPSSSAVLDEDDVVVPMDDTVVEVTLPGQDKIESALEAIIQASSTSQAAFVKASGIKATTDKGVHNAATLSTLQSDVQIAKSQALDALAAALQAWQPIKPAVSLTDGGALNQLDFGAEHLRGTRMQVINVEINNNPRSMFGVNWQLTDGPLALLMLSDGVNLVSALTTAPSVLALLLPGDTPGTEPAVGKHSLVLVDADFIQPPLGQLHPLNVLSMQPLGMPPSPGIVGTPKLYFPPAGLPLQLLLKYAEAQAKVTSMFHDAMLRVSMTQTKANEITAMVDHVMNAVVQPPNFVGGHHHHHHHHGGGVGEGDAAGFEELYLRNNLERLSERWDHQRVEAAQLAEDNAVIAASAGELDAFMPMAIALLKTLTLAEALRRDSATLAVVTRLLNEVNSPRWANILGALACTSSNVSLLHTAATSFLNRMAPPAAGAAAAADGALTWASRPLLLKLILVGQALHSAAALIPGVAAAAAASGAVSYVDVMRSFKLISVERVNNHIVGGRTDNNRPTASCLRRLAQEIADLPANLPLADSAAVFVCVGEEDVTRWRCIITGPEGSPYANGCFIFDIFFPSTYPAKPPAVKLLTTGGGSVRFNPNLYNCGKVCLSLLGTWHGPGWEERVSTALQVFVAIQSQIMVPHPWYNEPGRGDAPTHGQPCSEALEYNASIRTRTVKYAMLEHLRHIDERFPELAAVIKAHFRHRRDAILARCAQWMAEGANCPAAAAERTELVGCVEQLRIELEKL